MLKHFNALKQFQFLTTNTYLFSCEKEIYHQTVTVTQYRCNPQFLLCWFWSVVSRLLYLNTFIHKDFLGL